MFRRFTKPVLSCLLAGALALSFAPMGQAVPRPGTPPQGPNGANGNLAHCLEEINCIRLVCLARLDAIRGCCLLHIADARERGGDQSFLVHLGNNCEYEINWLVKDCCYDLEHTKYECSWTKDSTRQGRNVRTPYAGIIHQAYLYAKGQIFDAQRAALDEIEMAIDPMP